MIGGSRVIGDSSFVGVMHMFNVYPYFFGGKLQFHDTFLGIHCPSLARHRCRTESSQEMEILEAGVMKFWAKGGPR